MAADLQLLSLSASVMKGRQAEVALLRQARLLTRFQIALAWSLPLMTCPLHTRHRMLQDGHLRYVLHRPHVNEGQERVDSQTFSLTVCV